MGDVTLADAADRATTGRDERDEQDGRQCESAAQGYELVWETPRFEIASSREAWIAKTRSRPVISKIFVMFRSLQTSES